MRTETRRKLNIGLLIGGAVGVGVAAAAGALVGDTERVTGYWTSATVAGDGSAQVTEVIDYSFGALAADKHGIYRVIPGLPRDTPVTVTSPDAPADTQITPEASGIRIRVGDPATTVSGRRRYQIDYVLPGVRVGDTVDWEAVGTEWEVGMERVEVHLVTPFELDGAACFTGSSGSSGTCAVRTVEPGHVVATVDDLSEREGVSIEGRVGAALAAAPAAPPAPTARPDNPSTGVLPPAGAAAAAVVAAGIPVTILVRRAGRERVATGGAADAAYAGAPAGGPFGAPPAGEVRIDAGQLAQLATTDFAPPPGIAPAQGGVLLREEVREEHKVAWLVQLAVEGIIDIDEERIRYVGSTTPSLDKQAVLNLVFARAGEVELGSYDRDFAAGWALVGHQLEDWRTTSGLWDPKGDRRRAWGRALGIVGLILGVLGAVLGGAIAAWAGEPGVLVAAAAGVLAGGALALALAAWELRVRTPHGSALWLRVESFRRFLAGSEAYHAEEAAKRGVLREYTAWALAVGEIDRWTRAVNAAAIPPDVAGASYVYIGPVLLASTLSTSTPPSSSGSGGGGFGGGSVGGGAGGGGGGSW